MKCLNLNNNILQEFSGNKEFIDDVINFVNENSLKIGAYSFWVDEEWEPIVFMLKELKGNAVITNAYICNVTFAVRFKGFMEHLLNNMIDMNFEEEVISQCTYYYQLGEELVKYQIANCEEKDKWYFKNLKML